MATRLDIELTSDRGDGTMTWRAAGAKQPKGVVPTSLLPDGAKVGDVLRAEAEFTVDGPEVVSVAAPKGARQDKVQRLEMLGSGSNDSGGVTTQLARKQRGRRNDRSRGDRGDRSRGDRRGSGGGGNRSRGDSRRPAALRLGRAHREAWIAGLPEARRPVAEQLLHEGRDGVAEALERQNKAAVADGRDPIEIGPIMRIADELAPALEKAEWHDKVDAAIESVDTADLRELRKAYSGGVGKVATATTDTLRSKLQARIDRDQSAWARDVRSALSEGRVVRALQRSGRPAKAGMPLPQDLVDELCKAANEALVPDEEPHRWSTVIEALANSPVRRLVRPEELPEDRDDDLLDTVERLGHLVPGVADAFGVEPRPPRRSGGKNRR